MNNKGFAITTILYGLLLIFCMLLISLLSILSVYRNNLEKLIEYHNGTRDIIKLEPITVTSDAQIVARGLYCYEGECRYYRSAH